MLKRKLIFVSIIVMALFAVSAVSANDNVTGDNGNFNAKIIAEDMYEEYDPSGNLILFDIEDLDGMPIEDAKPTVTYDNKKINADDKNEPLYEGGPGEYVIDVYPKAGKHKVKIELNMSKYQAKPVFINVKIGKIQTDLTLKKYVTTTNEYAVMKAIVKDKYGDWISEGKVKFKVNGKAYTVKVKNGIATKKIKLAKAKTYTYKATFTSSHYKTKTKSSKLYIKKAKDYYTLKITNPKIAKTFQVKLPYKKYVKILNAKNRGKSGYLDIDTGIKRPPEWGGGHYYVGLSTKDDYLTHYDYELGDYLFLRASAYLVVKKINLYTANF